MRVVVVGAGVAGLASAITLAQDGHDVVVLERDATPLPETPDEAFGWDRKSAPQVRHSHAFLARGRNVVRDHLPEVRTLLLASGATEVAWREMVAETMTPEPKPEDDDLVMLACRRTTFEWVLRTAALDTARVELRDGVTVESLCADGIRVTGVKTSEGTLDADAVVDATGRPSHLPAMLADHGITLEETKSDANIVYLSRFYRLRDDAEPPSVQAFSGADLGDIKVGIMRGDNRTFSITLAYFSEDEPMRALREPGAFDRAVALIPSARPWPEVSVSISPVHYMGGLINRVRHFVRDGKPVVHGLYAVGDSSVCTNPLYGRGCSLGLVHGVLLAEALATDEPALAFDEATKRELVPWYDAAVAQDAVMLKVHRGEPLGELDGYIRSVMRDGVFPASRKDPDVSRAWTRTFNLLGPPDALFSASDVMRTVLEVWNDRENRDPEPPAGPDRDAFLAGVFGED